MASRGKTAKTVQTAASKTSRWKLGAANLSDNKVDFTNIDNNPEASTRKRRGRGRAKATLSKTMSTPVAKPVIKTTRSTIMSIPHSSVSELEADTPYWKRRLTLNTNARSTLPTAKQAVAAATDWAEGQRDPDFEEFDLYDVVIQDPTEDDVVVYLGAELHTRMGDLQFLLQTRYEDPIDEARDYHEAIFVFKYDVPPDKERQYPRCAAVRDGQIRVARVWALSEVMDRRSAQEKCRADERKLLHLVLRQAGLANVSLGQWKEEMECRQLPPGPQLATTNITATSVRIERASTGRGPDAKDRPRPVNSEASENDMQSLAKKARLTTPLSLESRFPASNAQELPVLSLPAMEDRPSLATSSSMASVTPTSTASSVRPAPSVRPLPRPPDLAPRLQPATRCTPNDAEVVRIATNFCTEMKDELQAHFIQSTQYITDTVQKVVRQFVSMTVPGSHWYTEEQWQQVVNGHLQVQQKRFERKWLEQHSLNKFKPISHNPLARQLSCFIADYVVRYPSVEDIPQADIQTHTVALQRAGIRKQRGLLASWTKYWKAAIRTQCPLMVDQEANASSHFARPRSTDSFAGSHVGLLQTSDGRAKVPDVLERKRKRVHDASPDISNGDIVRPAKKARSDELRDVSIVSRSTAGPTHPLSGNSRNGSGLLHSPSDTVEHERQRSGHDEMYSPEPLTLPKTVCFNAMSEVLVGPRLGTRRQPVASNSADGPKTAPHTTHAAPFSQRHSPKLGFFIMARPFKDVYENWRPPHLPDCGLRHEHERL